MRARGDRLAKETQFNQIKDAKPQDDGSDNFPAIGNNQAVISAKNALLKAEGEKAALIAEGKGPEWPALKALENDIAADRRQLIAARSNVIETARNELNAARLQESNYSGALEEAKAQALDLDRKGGDSKVRRGRGDSGRHGLD